jgi:ClpP class serine protease
LGNEILDAATDPQVRGILLRCDSYGGEANGAWDVAGLIEEAAQIKPVWAAVDDWALSAGYLIASAADCIWVTRTGGVGSVGIIAMHLDQSGWDVYNGLKYTTVFAGARKNDFTPHEPLSAGARDVLASEVDRLYGMFVDAVARRRSASVQAVRGTEAGILYGEDSVAQGFADRVGTFREALAEMTALVSKPKFAKGGTIVSEAIQAVATAPAVDIQAIEAEARQQGYGEAAEIVALCNIAGRPALAGDFIARHTALGDVRKQLLTLRAEADQEEIRSHVRPEASTAANLNLDENPVVRACAALAAGSKGAK